MSYAKSNWNRDKIYNNPIYSIVNYYVIPIYPQNDMQGNMNNFAYKKNIHLKI
jgi:hypothetical protein